MSNNLNNALTIGKIALFSVGITGLMVENAMANPNPQYAAPQEALGVIQQGLQLRPSPQSKVKQNNLSQVTNVNELRDVEPTAWAYEALRSLVEKYGCIVGYPDQTFRGNRALTRWEFAAGLNACMNKMEELIQQNVAILKEDIDKLKALAEQFQNELLALGARLDNLEARVSFLEDHQFSTTTKLKGEVSFTWSNAFGDTVNPGTGLPNPNAQASLFSKTRLQLATSFTGRDVLYTRLTAGSIGNSFANEIGDNQGRFAYDGFVNNNLVIDRLHYYFPIGENLRIFTMASAGGHHFYAETFNAGLEAGGGSNGALTRFGERNPIYRLGLGGQGIGATYKFGKVAEFSGGYLARGGNSPSPGRGLFNGNYSIMGQLVLKPTNKIKFGLTYFNAYDPNGTVQGRNQAFAFGGTGTQFANLQLGSLGIANRPVSSNSYGIQGQFDISPRFSVRAWGGYTDAKLIGLGEADIWNYALTLAFPDLIKRGSMGYILVGAEPYLGGLSVPVPTTRPFTNDVPIHVEVAYKFQINNNISLTPGVIVLTAPNQDSRNNDTVVIGAFRTTYQF